MCCEDWRKTGEDWRAGGGDWSGGEDWSAAVGVGVGGVEDWRVEDESIG